MRIIWNLARVVVLFMQVLFFPLRVVWAVYAILMTLAIYGSATTGMAIGVWLWPIFFPGRERPSLQFLQKVCGYSLLYLVFWPSFIRASIDMSGLTPLKPGDTVVAHMPHPSSTVISRLGHLITSMLPPPWRWTIKMELMEWAIGKGLVAIDSAIVVDRGDKAQAAAAISNVGFSQGSALIFSDSTRPKHKIIVAGRKRLQDMGRWDLADGLTETGTPFVGGSRALIRQNPNARHIVIMAAASFHEEGFLGALRMVPFGHISIKVIDLPSRLVETAKVDPGAGEVAIFPMLFNEFWVCVVNKWIREDVRGGYPALPPGEMEVPGLLTRIERELRRTWR